MAHNAGREWWRPAAAPGPALPGAATGQAGDSAVPFRALMAFTFILLLAPQALIPGLARLHIALLAGLIAVVAHCWPRFVARRPLMRFTRETWLAGGLLGWAIATIPLSMWAGGSLLVLFDLYLKALIVFWLLSETVTTLGRLRTVAWALSLMAAPVAITGLKNFLLHRTFSGSNRILGYVSGVTGNPNDLALMLNLILPLTAALFFISPRPRDRGLLAGLIVLDASAIIVTFSRGGLITLLTILLLYVRPALKWGQGKWAVLALVLAVAAVPFLPSGYMERLGTIVNTTNDQTGSAQERERDAGVALAFVLHHPVVGAGLGEGALALNELRGPTWTEVHNVYLNYAVDLGLPGLGLFLLLLIGCVNSAARVRDRCAGLPALRELSALAEAIRITLVAFAVAAFFHPVAYQFHFYYFAGLAVGLGGVYAAEVGVRPGSGTPRR